MQYKIKYLIWSCTVLITENKSKRLRLKRLRQVHASVYQLHVSHYQKYHNTLCLPLQNFSQALFSLYFCWDLQWSQEKLETMLMRNFRGTNKEYYGIFDIGQVVYNHVSLYNFVKHLNLSIFCVICPFFVVYGWL